MRDVDPIWLTAEFDLSTTALVGVDVDGKVVRWSRGAEALFGWQADDLRGRPPAIVPSALQHEWQLQIQRVVATGQATAFAETQRVTRDGRSIGVLRTSAPVVDAHGHTIGVIELLIDTTALKQLDLESRAMAQARERELIAMDLHDGIVQSLYAVVLDLAAREQMLDRDTVEAIRAARAQVERAIGETRGYIEDLRGRSVTPHSLEAGVRPLLDGLRRNAGVDVQLALDPSIERMLGSEVRGHVLYVVHEAVSNVLRHAAARHVRIALAPAEGAAMLTIEDDGRGFDVSAVRHHGLHNIAERARLVDGKLDITSTPTRGTRVSLRLPL